MNTRFRSPHNHTRSRRERRGLIRTIGLLVAACVALSISITLSPLTTQTAVANTDAAATVLDQYRLAATPDNREILRNAVSDRLTSEGTTATTAAIDAELARLASLAEPDIAATAYLAVELFDASSRRPKHRRRQPSTTCSSKWSIGPSPAHQPGPGRG